MDAYEEQSGKIQHRNGNSRGRNEHRTGIKEEKESNEDRAVDSEEVDRGAATTNRTGSGRRKRKC